ncbi:hypothetical protein [Pelagibacterium xiamenense]|uniref:hypothetical protein n=1 Tax=Pelagibacterium xiamenense TaxID=2901140 RepID=UPI001E507FB6|nr:hypothetical protein [Pelagibacterium xiamenense]MCD7059687.1 hypothetical protein [Pelagibacterium xiamenense]
MPFETPHDAEIWLIGGYGDVGTKLARRVLDTSGHRIVLAGRNAAKAETAAASLGRRARGTALDASAGLPSDARIVVNFVEALPPSAAATVVKRGGLYIDASADPEYLTRLEAALPSGPGLAVLNAGLTPGLTNVLARDLKEAHPQTRRIDVVLEMGMGRHHGHAAVVWTLAGLGGTYRARRDGVWRTVAPGRERRQVRFAPGERPVPAIGFAFSDQVAIARALDLDEARTFLAVAPASTTRLLGLLAGRRAGAFVARRADAIARLMAALPPLGPVCTRLLVEAFDGSGTKLGAHAMRSGDQSDITAAMLALAVSAGVTTTAHGVRNFDDIVMLDASKTALEAALPGTAWPA